MLKFIVNLMTLSAQIIQDLSQLHTEIWTFVVFLGMLLLAIFEKKSIQLHIKEIWFCISLLIWGILNLSQNRQSGYFLSELLFIDAKDSWVSKSILLIFCLFFLFFLQKTKQGKAQEKLHESYLLVVSSTFAPIQLLISSNHLFLTFVCLEFISIASYILVGSESGKNSAEVAFKFFINGAIASAFLLFGISLIFTQSPNLTYNDFVNLPSSEIKTLAQIFIILGFSFKLTIFPFHAWIGDFYEKANLKTVFFVSLVPKLAILWAFFKLLKSFESDFTFLALLFVLATMLVGAVLAIMQKSSRRLLAYSSVSQVGFLLACLFHHEDANLALAYYWFGYSLGTMGLIWAIKILEEQTENDLISSFSHIKDVSFVVLILLSVFSLIGLPLAIGFWGKLYLFLSIWQQYLQTQDLMYLLLNLVFIVSTAISVYFYLKIPFYILIRKSNENVEKSGVGLNDKINALIISMLLLLLFFMPNLVKILF